MKEIKFESKSAKENYLKAILLLKKNGHSAFCGYCNPYGDVAPQRQPRYV